MWRWQLHSVGQGSDIITEMRVDFGNNDNPLVQPKIEHCDPLVYIAHDVGPASTAGRGHVTQATVHVSPRQISRNQASADLTTSARILDRTIAHRLKIGAAMSPTVG